MVEKILDTYANRKYNYYLILNYTRALENILTDNYDIILDSIPIDHGI